MLEKGQRHTVTVEGYANQGHGVARIDGQVVFVKGAILGDTCQVEIEHVGHAAAWAHIVELLDPSSERLGSDCPYYGRCGGCQTRHMSYAEELRFKAAKVENALRHIGGVDPGKVPIHGADRPERYRNKVQFPVSETAIGYFQERTHTVIDVDDCLLTPAPCAAIRQAVKTWMATYHIPAYDEQAHQGLVRHLYIRTNAAGEVLVCLVANSRSLPHEPELVAALRAAEPKLVGVVLNENQRQTNVILGKRHRTLWGQDYLMDTLRGLSFKLSVPSFFQVNRPQAEVLYSLAADFAGLTGTETVLDLYCGTGTIGLTLASRAKEVIGAEIVAPAVADARENAARNGVKNARFLCGDARRTATQLESQRVRPDVVIVDPPRKGLSPELIDTLLRMAPAKIVYVSCDPATLARDLKALCKGKNYTLTKVEAVDMFPRTFHVETVCLLVKHPAKEVLPREHGLKLKIRDILTAPPRQRDVWVEALRDYVNAVMGEDNVLQAQSAVTQSQERAWADCFSFLATTLSRLWEDMLDYELIFEYSLPGTVHERPDLLLLTDKKVISLEFKRKSAPQIDDNKDDIAQAIRYREWLKNHHAVTRQRGLEVKSYLVCTPKDAVGGTLRGIQILTKADFLPVVEAELKGQRPCGFAEKWLASPKTEMPGMLRAIEIMYQEGRIPYLSDVNKTCLQKVLGYIADARKNHKKLLILINGVPGAGKTAVGQSIVYEENKNGAANAVYLSGNAPLVEVLQYQIDQVGRHAHMGENAIQRMKSFKVGYFALSPTKKNRRVPEQSVLVFDEAQRARNAVDLRRGFSEPEGLFDVGERIFAQRGYAVLVGLYGNGQVIYDSEEQGVSLWREALQRHAGWSVVASETIAAQLQGLGARRIVDNDVFLPISLRADFVDCSKWVEQAIGRSGATREAARRELARLQHTSLRIFVTRSMGAVRERIKQTEADHPKWKYGILLSNFADPSVVRRVFPGWDIGYRGDNRIANGGYGPWFSGGCMELSKACTAYGCQGLELDRPIVLFDGSYIRERGQWVSGGESYHKLRGRFRDPDAIVENNFRILLTRARKEMILLIPNDPGLDETFQYFVDMGVDVL